MADAPQKTIDCLRRYLSKVYSAEQTKGFEPLMIFADVKSKDTILDWLHDRSKPLGPRLLKIRYFLEKEGYQIFELEKLDRAIYQLGKFIAFGQLSLEQAKIELNYKSIDTLLDILLRGEGLSQEKWAKLTILLKNLGWEVVPVQIMAIREKQADKTKITLEPAIANNYQEQITPDFEEETITLLRMLKKNIKLLNPRLAELISDKVSAQNRGIFRDHAGKELVSELTSELGAIKLQLNSMCSETARNLNLQKNEMGG